MREIYPSTSKALERLNTRKRDMGAEGHHDADAVTVSEDEHVLETFRFCCSVLSAAYSHGESLDNATADIAKF